MRRLVLAILLALSACGPDVQSTASLPEVVAAQQAAAAQPYRLQPGDQLEIRHLVHVDYSTLTLVKPDGMITVPGLRHGIHAAGMTIPELKHTLTALYTGPEGMLANPNFAVLLRAAPAQRVFVGGEVQRPGYVELQGIHSVMQAVLSAGGPTSSARTDSVMLIRNQADGRRVAIALDLDKVLDGEDLGQDVALRPSDIVVVPRTDIASLDLWVDQYIRRVLPVQGSIGFTYQP